MTIDNESPKNTELLLKKLTLFQDECYSHLFSHKFETLMRMNLRSFHDFLESCYFQTMQMKTIKYLKLNNKNLPWSVPHSSCLIDKAFTNKYCSFELARAKLLETKRKEQEEKARLEQEERMRKEQEERAKRELQDDAKEEQKGEEDKEEEKKEESKEDGEEDELLEQTLQQKDHTKTPEEIAQEIERKSQVRLTIRAIEFDWIFDDHRGKSFLRALSKTNDLELFSLSIIRTIVLFLWEYYRKVVFIFLLIPFLINFAVFIVYATYFHKKQKENNESFAEGFGIASIISIVIVLIFVVINGLYEARQMLSLRLMYFISFWNMVDLISLLLNLTVWVADLAGMTEERFVPLSAVAILFIWLKLFYFGRIFISTAGPVRMIIAIFTDMTIFMMIFLLAVAGFGNCFLILARNNSENIFTGNTYWRAFIYSYRAALGDFTVDSFDGKDKHLLFTIWMLNTVILLIILLNMIVAVMGDTFDKVKETEMNNTLKELTSIMVENDLLISKRNEFGNAKYIIVIQEEKAEEESDVMWDGKLQRLRKYLENTVLHQYKILQNLEKEIGKVFRERIEKWTKEMENSTNKSIAAMNTRMESLDSLVEKCKREFQESGE